MIKTILASLTGFESDRTVLDAAVAAARIDGAHIDCLHTRIDVSQTADFIGAAASHRDVLQDLTQKLAVEERGRSEHARAAFEQATKRHALPAADKAEAGVSARWTELATLQNETLHQARLHDLTVMARDPELSAERIHNVLMQSGRPLLLAPARPVAAIGRVVALAWKEGPSAARAVTAAMPVLAKAGQVFLLSVPEGGKTEDISRASAEALAGQLRRHGVKAELRLKPAQALSVSETLLEMAYACGADLLVSGAYGHSRMREFVFGGVTRDLLKDSGLPLFLFH
jgi:nucleotide-binding universal stress UspA family protein